MKAYLPFGDWPGDGHCQYDDILVDINSMNDLLIAQEKIKQQYGETFFKDYANVYDTPQLSERCWQALIDHHMPIEILENSELLDEDDEINNIQDFLKTYPNPYVNLDFIEYSFIWLLNEYGANIKILSDEENIPQINNWTCPGFETVGYGCFT